MDYLKFFIVDCDQKIEFVKKRLVEIEKISIEVFVKVEKVYELNGKIGKFFVKDKQIEIEGKVVEFKNIFMEVEKVCVKKKSRERIQKFYLVFNRKKFVFGLFVQFVLIFMVRIIIL